jgi:integrase
LSETLPTPSGAGGVPAALADKVRAILEAADAVNTRRAYAADWRAFEAWCRDHRLEPLPASPETVGAYLSDQAGTLKASTLTRRVAGIAWVHRQAGIALDSRDRAIAQVLKGIRNTYGRRKDQKAPLLTDDIILLLSRLSDGPQGLQERAVILVGFASAMRRSELAGSDIEHITWKRDGIEILVPRSKTDQQGEGQQIGIVYGHHERSCPVRALKAWTAWLAEQGVASGPLFRRLDRRGALKPGRLPDGAIADMVKRLAKRAGLDPAAYAGHSLRSGHVTQGRANNVDDATLMRQTRHARVETLSGYDRNTNLLKRNSSGGLGL